MKYYVCDESGPVPAALFDDVDVSMPAIFDCGCSRHKVKAGLCDIYSPDGKLRKYHAKLGPVADD